MLIIMSMVLDEEGRNVSIGIVRIVGDQTGLLLHVQPNGIYFASRIDLARMFVVVCVVLAMYFALGIEVVVERILSSIVIVEHGLDTHDITLADERIISAFVMLDGMSGTNDPSDDLRFRVAIIVAVATLPRTYRLFNNVDIVPVLLLVTTFRSCMASMEAPSALAYAFQELGATIQEAILIARKAPCFIAVLTRSRVPIVSQGNEHLVRLRL